MPPERGNLATLRSILPLSSQLRSAMSVPDMEADENGAHGGYWMVEPARRDRGVLVPLARLGS